MIQRLEGSNPAPAALAEEANSTPSRLDLPAGIRPVRWLWAYVIPLVTVHLLALLAFFPSLFSWTGVILALVGTYVYGGLGINLCYHRLLAHRSFRCPVWLERFFVVVACCCLEDTPARWVATHRKHHRESDQPADPHSPLAGFWWGHFGWLFVHNREIHNISAFEFYARDLVRDPFYLMLERKPLLPIWIYLAHATLYWILGLLAGLALWGWDAALPFANSVLVWGVFVRTVAVWHITWSVNSLTHLFGYRTYPTQDNSRNNWLVALVSNGEGWHNNHHADPASASNRHRWWEFDGIWGVIWLLEKVGLATDVVRPRHERRRSNVLD